MRTIILLAFGLILVSLGSGLFHLVREDSGSKKTVRALTWRIGLSVSLMLLLLVAWALGWISPLNQSS